MSLHDKHDIDLKKPDLAARHDQAKKAIVAPETRQAERGCGKQMRYLASKTSGARGDGQVLHGPRAGLNLQGACVKACMQALGEACSNLFFSPALRAR